MIQDIIKNPAHRLILFVGIGNVLKRDDGVGVYITQHLNSTDRLQGLPVEVSIENYIGKINSLSPDVLILIDCMDLQQQPGYWDLLPAKKINGHTTNTHNISLDRVCELFHSQVYILGIQPRDITLGENLSPAVKKTANSLVKMINQVGQISETC